MPNYQVVIDHKLCWGCRTCEVACKQENRAAEGVKLISVRQDGPRWIDDPSEFVFQVNLCRHCEEPPCAEACPEEAIMIGEDITNLPVLDEEKCTGCGLCISACPGLAISVVDLTYSDDEAVVRIPHEFLPLPAKEDKVKCLSREGKVIADGRIGKVLNPKSHDRTPVLWVVVPKAFAMDVRAIRLAPYMPIV